jgi:hypothetical protein
MNTLERLQAHLMAQPVSTYQGAGGMTYTYKDCAPYIECADGSTMSAQARESAYCTPRDNYGPYTSVEVWCCGYVKAFDDAGYGDGEYPYAYVPIELVVAEINARGGFK